MSPAGTIRACRPSRASAGPACRRPRSAISSSASRRQGQQRGRCRHVRILRARGAQQDGAAAHGGAQAAQVTIENYPEGQVEELEAVNHPDDPAAGSRKIKFARELYIEQDDFMENPRKEILPAVARMEVRLRYAYFITCREVVKNAVGEVIELALHVRPGDQRRQRAGRPQGEATIHWVSAAQFPSRRGACLQSAVRPARSERRGEFLRRSQIRNSLEVLSGARLEPALLEAKAEQPVQFERQGYFCLDRESTPERPVFIRHHRAAGHVRQGCRKGSGKDQAKAKAAG